jgi:hypothetical protein
LVILVTARRLRNAILSARSFFLTAALVGAIEYFLRQPTIGFNSVLGIVIQGVPFIQVLLSLIIASFLSLMESLQTIKPPPDRSADLTSIFMGAAIALLFLLGSWLGILTRH